VPDEGTSHFQFNGVIANNIVTYLGATFDFWPTISDGIKQNYFTLTPSHFILGGLCAYHLLRRRIGTVLFGAAFIFFTLFPALFLFEHYFYYHMYIPALGIFYLLGRALQDVFSLLPKVRLGTGLKQLGVAAMLIIAFAVMSTISVRHNVKRAHDPRERSTASFVLRRAIMAETAYNDLMKKAGDLSNVGLISFVFGGPGQPLGNQNRDTFWALADGYAPRLFFDEYEAEVRMAYSALGVESWESERSRVFFYDREGHCYTFDEVIRK
jgi:hypothetical protein